MLEHKVYVSDLYHTRSTSLLPFDSHTNNLRLHYKHLTSIFLASTHEVHGVGCLQEFLLEIQASPNVEYGELADILVRQAQSADEVTRMTALRWLRAFVSQAKDQLMPYYAIILAAVLPNVSHNNQDICQVRCAFWSGQHAMSYNCSGS